jgi:hypothetical protein
LTREKSEKKNGEARSEERWTSAEDETETRDNEEGRQIDTVGL